MSLQQYDVIAAPANAGYPYFVVLQSDMLSELATRVVAPLVDATKIGSLETLWPKVAVSNNAYVVLIPLLQSIRTDASMTPVTSLSDSAATITSAIELLHGTID